MKRRKARGDAGKRQRREEAKLNEQRTHTVGVTLAAHAAMAPTRSQAPSLPSCWNAGDAHHRLLKVSEHGLKLAYKGLGSVDTETGAIRADNPAPGGEPLYYYEVTIISKDRKGYIGVGLSSSQASLSRLPGFERNSFGYHADDGNAFTGCCASTLNSEGTPYGPPYGAGDVIGCLLNQMEHTISFTKNGVHLGVAFRDVKGLDLYPTVGLRTPGEKVKANFGSKPFVFDLEEVQKALRMKTLLTIDAIEIPDKNSCLHSLVVSYLMHYGYSDTATALVRESALEGNVISPKEGESMRLRRKIQEAILEGRIDEMKKSDPLGSYLGALSMVVLVFRLFILRQYVVAIEQTNYVAPEVFMSQPSVLFHLKCQKFIEMIKSGDDEATMSYGRTELSEFDGESEEDKQHLQDVISLLAYPRPEISPFRHLILPSHRQSVADSLNQAILVAQDKPALPALEMLHKQISVTKELFSQRSPGSASMINAYEELHGLSDILGSWSSGSRDGRPEGLHQRPHGDVPEVPYDLASFQSSMHA